MLIPPSLLGEMADERRREKVIRLELTAPQTATHRSFIRADGGRRLKAIRQKYNRNPNSRLAVGLRTRGLWFALCA